MSVPSLFEADSYKEVVMDLVRLKREKVGPGYTYQRLAQACGIQKAYLSRVLNTEGANLSEEQLHRAAVFLGLSKSERDFLQLLRLRDRAQRADYRDEIDQDIERMRAAQRKTDTYLATEPSRTAAQDLTAYYLDPNIMLAHIFLTIDRYQERPAEIAAALRLSDAELEQILRQLESMELIRFDGERHRPTKRETHLSADAPIYRSFRTLQRIKSLEQQSRLATDKSYCFSVAFSTTAEVRSHIHRKILELIGEAEALVSAGDEHEVYQLNIDLFDWT